MPAPVSIDPRWRRLLCDHELAGAAPPLSRWVGVDVVRRNIEFWLDHVVADSRRTTLVEWGDGHRALASLRTSADALPHCHVHVWARTHDPATRAEAASLERAARAAFADDAPSDVCAFAYGKASAGWAPAGVSAALRPATSVRLEKRAATRRVLACMG